MQRRVNNTNASKKDEKRCSLYRLKTPGRESRKSKTLLRDQPRIAGSKGEGRKYQYLLFFPGPTPSQPGDNPVKYYKPTCHTMSHTVAAVCFSLLPQCDLARVKFAQTEFGKMEKRNTTEYAVNRRVGDQRDAIHRAEGTTIAILPLDINSLRLVNINFRSASPSPKQATTTFLKTFYLGQTSPDL